MVRTSTKKKIEASDLFEVVANGQITNPYELQELLKEFWYAVHSLDRELCKEAEKLMWDEIEIDDED